MRLTSEADLDRLDFAKGGGLLPLIAQEAHGGEVLMLGFADRAALTASLRDGELSFLSRRRRRLWRKGETSGHTLRLLSLHADCDGDAVLARVEPRGPTCHTGARSCFAAPPLLVALADVVAARATETAAAASEAPAAAPSSYTRRLLADPNLRLKKLGEESTELALACAAGDPARVAEEAADLLYHLLVAASAAGAPLSAVLAALGRRRGDAASRIAST
jgi:phosphoribosyl-AMP cyclohydrolase / phosphoribosyl-ATP pyrophosphohydrolase